MKEIYDGVLKLLTCWVGIVLICLGIYGFMHDFNPLFLLDRDVYLWSAFIAYVLSVLAYIIYDWKRRRDIFFEKQYEKILKKMGNRNIKFEDEGE